jgi:F-type H+-transporting ATPase subunit epsilon
MKEVDSILKLSIISPEKVIYSQNVDMVVMPGSEGRFGVLPGHIGFVSSLSPGIIEIYHGNDISKKMFVYSGLAEVSVEECSVLAEDSFDLSEINIEEVKKRIEDLTARLESKKNISEKEAFAAKKEILVAQAMLEFV